MAEISTNKPACYDSVKTTVNSSRLTVDYQQKPSKSPKSSRRDEVGVSRQICEKHKNFKRRDTPMQFDLTGSQPKNGFKPALKEELLEEQEN